MKILGVTSADSLRRTLYLKPDSSMLVNRKPFFLPDFAQEMVACPCIVLRISRLGKNIAPRFADRYFTEAAAGYNLKSAASAMSDTVAQRSVIETYAFDYTAVVGEFRPTESLADEKFVFEARIGEELIRRNELTATDMICTAGEALNSLSRYVTVRMGDMVCVDFRCEPFKLQPEMLLTAEHKDQQTLFCRIK